MRRIHLQRKQAQQVDIPKDPGSPLGTRYQQLWADSEHFTWCALSAHPARALPGGGYVDGMGSVLAFRLDDRRIGAHLRAVERVLRRRDTSVMAPSLQRRRAEMLDRLADYTRRGAFPRNRSGRLLSPVFVDSDGRECAVAHLIGSDVDLVAEISGSHNLATIRELPHPALGRWQRESGLSVGELALIQPQYVDAASVAMSAVPGMLALLAGIVGARISHAGRVLRFRLTEPTPNLGVLISAMVAAIAGWWLAAQGRRAWALPDVGETPMFGAWRDVAYEIVVWMLIAAGVVGVIFGLATVLRRIASVSSSRSLVADSNLVGSLQHRTIQLITACLAIIGPLVWAFAVTTIAQLLPQSVFCATGRALRSQWLPIPHRQCLLDGQVVTTSYADTLLVALAIAPIAWVVARALIQAKPPSSLEAASHNTTR